MDAQLRADDVVARRARAAADQGAERQLLEGDQPRRVRRRALARGPAVARCPGRRPRNGRWIQTIKVVDRGLRSTQFIGAGKVEDILPGSSRLALPQSDGTFVTSSKPLRPGDSYQAQVYVPHPSDSQLRRSGTRYPAYTQDFLEVRVPLRGAVRRPRRPGHRAAAGHQRRHPLQHLRHSRRGGHRVAERLRRPAGRRQRHGRLALRPAVRPTQRSGAPRIRPSTSYMPSWTACSWAPPMTRTRRGARTRWPRSSSTPRPATASSSPA